MSDDSTNRDDTRHGFGEAIVGQDVECITTSDYQSRSRRCDLPVNETALDAIRCQALRVRRRQERRQGRLAANAEVAVAVERYRLVTRSDFDGLVCAVLLRQLGLVEDILFVHPKDVQQR